MERFWPRDYETTSLQGLMKAMGLPGSIFYQAFGGTKRQFLRGQKEGEITADPDPEKVAGYLIRCLVGPKTVVKGGVDEQSVRDIVAVTLRALR